MLVRASFAFDGAEDGDLRIARGERLSCLRADYEAARASRKVADLEDVAADGRWDEERDDLELLDRKGMTAGLVAKVRTMTVDQASAF